MLVKAHMPNSETFNQTKTNICWKNGSNNIFPGHLLEQALLSVRNLRVT